MIPIALEMSSSYAQSDGVTFLSIGLPELLPKNHDAFVAFRAIHKILAYTLLGLVVLYIAGVVKHRIVARVSGGDVLPRML